ncbi:trypsin-3-like [Aricia agestis]|uniref:trypsin-3-like n=1 Tax=Aricia agestis TaxID=91739 RepID=UPI001C20BD2B|nr:trypsin-3-like [Aricia agestis]
MWRRCTACPLLLALVLSTARSIQTEDSRDADDLGNSDEHIGAAVTQVSRHPYAASLLYSGTYVCSAIVLNNNWLLTPTKCFDTKTILSYVSHKNLGNYSVRAGSSYNNKGGSIHEINMLINNFDFKMSVIKLSEPLQLGARVAPVLLPPEDYEVTLGDLASVIAWTPSGHIRIVNVPVMNPSICDTTLLPGHYVCVGGVQDPDRHFCRKDNGGAVVQNNTLIAVASFLRSCASYTKTHAFPRVASFTRWVKTAIWDGDTTTELKNSFTTSKTELNNTDSEIYYAEPESNSVNANMMMLSLPFDPVDVPLEPGENNSILPKMSIYESYLRNKARTRTSPSPEPDNEEEITNKKKWLEKYGRQLLMIPGKYGQYENKK